MEGGKLVSQAQALFLAAQAEHKSLIAIHIRKAPSIHSKDWKCTLSFVLDKGLAEKPEYRIWEFDLESKAKRGF